jgi:hypothetical protein
LGRDINDWSEIKRSNFGIRNDMIIKLEPENFIIDTLHLRIRILEKLFSSIISSVINYKKDTKNLIIDELNKNMKINNISASINSEIKSEFYIKYKLQSPNLNTKIKSMDHIISYINEKFHEFSASKYFGIIWKVCEICPQLLNLLSF